MKCDPVMPFSTAKPTNGKECLVRVEPDVEPDQTATELFLGTLKRHASNNAPEVRDMIRKVFSSGRKFHDYKVYKCDEFKYTEPAAKPTEFAGDFSCNPFAVLSERIAVDLLTDSGTNKLTDEQTALAAEYNKLVPSIEIFSYARSTPREHLELVFRECFGDQFKYYPALQGRAAEKVLLQATIEVGVHERGDRIISNRPFDTTKGHIGAAGLHVDALTPLAGPGRYYNASSAFLGNIEESVFLKSCADVKYKTLLVTLTDNGGGGQPMSMANFKFLVKEARKKSFYVWVDGCRIFENALFIKTFEDGYENKTITEIAKEILSFVDFSSVSFKKMYSHSGGGIFVNRNSFALSETIIQGLDGSIKRQTTTDYGNGYKSYSGLTGGAMIEMMTGLMMACDEEITGRRIAQVGEVACFMKQCYNFPIVAGGHALYIAADQVLPAVPLTHCPAEYLNAMMMASIKMRGCGLGLLVYGGRVEYADGIIELRNTLTMDSLRLAIPRNQYSSSEIMSQLQVLGEAFRRGAFEKLNSGLYPKNYIDNGFYHFGADYSFKKREEFESTVTLLKQIQAGQQLRELGDATVKPCIESPRKSPSSNKDPSNAAKPQSVLSSRLRFVIAAVFMAGAFVAAVPLVLLLAIQSTDSSAASSPPSSMVSSTCWKPILEMDGYGFPRGQRHVAGFLQDATDAMLVMNPLPAMSLAPGAKYDYPTEVNTLVMKLASVTTKAQTDEIKFFDGKLNIALGIIGTLLLGYGQSIEEIMFQSFGETTSVHDSGVAVWKNKLMNSRIRPTTVIQQVYPNKTFTINDGIQVKGKHFQALVRVMPHSEYPSGSSCVCQAIEEYVTDLWPALSLTSAGAPISFDPKSTPIVLPNMAMPIIPLTGAVNPGTSGYTAQTLSRRCGETREEGGMHFTPAVPAGRALCAGMGSATASKMKTLIPGLKAGSSTVRNAISSTPACEAMCCSDAVACSQTDQDACAAKCKGTWDTPWFDIVQSRMQAFGLPDRTTATTMAAPFFQADRNHILIIGMMGSLVPEIMKTETIFHFRYTNTIDNLVWNAIAANSAILKAIKFGQSQEAEEPIIRSGQATSDARIVTAIHAVAAALPLLLPSVTSAFEATPGFMLLTPTIGVDSSLTAACGAPEWAATTFSAACLQSWYLANKGPSRLGQVLAYEIMYYKTRDGWNSLGVDGGCDAGAHFCHRYADITGYDPEVGECLRESLSA